MIQRGGHNGWRQDLPGLKAWSENGALFLRAATDEDKRRRALRLKPPRS
jgi:hypothetical protein